MSPIGDAFRTRLRQFPSLVNCCTIDWFTAWPQDALQTVAEQFLTTVDGVEHASDAIVSMCCAFQSTVRLAHISPISPLYLHVLRLSEHGAHPHPNPHTDPKHSP